MHAGVHSRIPSLAAAAMAERRSSVFKKTLSSAARSIFPAQNPISLENHSLETKAARKAATFLEFAELDRYRSVLKASARGRRVS